MLNVLQDQQSVAQNFHTRMFGTAKVGGAILKLRSASELISILQNSRKRLINGDKHLAEWCVEQNRQRLTQGFLMRTCNSIKLRNVSLKLRNADQSVSNQHQNKPSNNTNSVQQQQNRVKAQPFQKQNFDASNANQEKFKLHSTFHELVSIHQPKAEHMSQNELERTKFLTDMSAEQKRLESLQLIQKRKFDDKKLKLNDTKLDPFAPSSLQQSPKKRKKRGKGAKRLTKWWYEPKMREKMNKAIAAVRVDDQSLQLVSASHNIPPRTLSRYVKASFQPESPFYVGEDKWRSKPFKIGQIRTCIAAMVIDGLGIQKASALYSVPHFTLTRYLRESKECADSPFYFKPAPPASKHAAYLGRVKEAIRCHRRGFYGGASMGQLLSLLYEDCIQEPGGANPNIWDPRQGGAAMLRPLLVMVESLPEILTNVILTLRSYVFQAPAMQKPDGDKATEERVPVPWLRTAPSVYGQDHGTILNDLVATILVTMRKHTSRPPIQILCLETLDKLSTSFSDVALFECRPDGSHRVARELVTSYGILTAEEAAVITAMAAHGAKMRYGAHSMKDRSRVEAGPLDLSCAYPCNDASTRRFFGTAWLGEPSIYTRWANKQYESMSPPNPQTHAATDVSFEVGGVARFVEPPMASVWLAAKYRTWAAGRAPDEHRSKKCEDHRLRQLAMICCATSPKRNADFDTSEAGPMKQARK